MTRAELLEIIRNGENSGAEFKIDTIDNRGLAKEIVGLVNFSGGYIVLGIDDEGGVCGLNRADASSGPSKRSYKGLEEWVMQICRDIVRPEIIPYFEIFRDLEPGKDVAVIEVERGWTVHHLWHKNHRTYFIRVGTTTREASPDELERLFQRRGALRVEMRGMPGTTIEDLDMRRLKDYFGRVRQQLTADDTEAAWSNLLINTELMKRDDSHNLVTLGGMLLFGRNPRKFLTQAGITAFAFQGAEKDYDFKDRATFTGPMLPLLSEHGIVENGTVEQAIEFIRRNTRVEAHLDDGIRRVERREYPDEVLREAVVNALVHRDYLLSSTDIELSLYSDRLEIISPGSPPNGITPESMKAGCRVARNQLLTFIMRDYGYMEQIGMGIPRKIVKGMREHNGTEPDLIAENERFVLRLWREKKST
jgi:ATP-dependent DNA helicase RecG